MATATDIQWDGTIYPYIPPAELKIHPSLRLHEECDERVDPITHEVIRHALWSINLEHGNTIVRVSGSPFAAYGHDFNPAILDEKGDYVFSGPFLQYLSAATGSQIKWTLEYRSENPGIHPGDIFLTNDPWVGAQHQSDTGVLAPVFVGEELFCWVTNTLHQWDLGGTAPGGFNPMAENVFWEPPCIPPVKIVERGVLRQDVKEWYVRSSRVPDLVALDLHAEISGCNVARERTLRLVSRYGASTLKATMRKLQDDSEAAFVRRLEHIPDGTWTEEGWMEVKLPGDRGLYKNRLTLTKKGDRLIFSNRGSAPQQGSFCAVYAAWKGAVVSMLNSMMLYDQMFVIEGALRHCDFDVEPGTITCATHPAAVSGAPPLTLIQSIGLGGLVLSKMLATSSDEALRSEVQSCMGVLSFPISTIHGTDQYGRLYTSFLTDPIGAAGAASSWRDGQDTGGWPWDLQSTMPNVEENELFYPFIYLWRKELPDSGGAGKFRGGNSCELAVTPHKTDRIDIVTVTSELAVPGPGLFGGYPSSTNKYQLVKGTKLREQLARTGRMPTDVSELSGEVDWVPAKSFDRSVSPDGVWILAWAAAAGYGDPLERDPELVLADVVAGRTTPDWAARAYGVVIVGEGVDARLDAEATERRREALLAERLADAKPVTTAEGDGDEAPSVPADGSVTEYVKVAEGEFRCGEIPLGPATGNYKRGALARELPLTEANPHLRDPALYVDPEVKFRQLICPRTGRLLQTEVVVENTPPQWDIRVGDTRGAR